MKKLQITLLNFILCVLPVKNIFAQNGQIVINSAKIIVNSGATINGQAIDLTNNSGTITNNGKIVVTGNINNATTATIYGSGTYQLNGNWTNQGTFTAGTSEIVFVGNTNSTMKTGLATINKVSLQKTKARVILNDSMHVNTELKFLKDSNFVELGANSLSLNTTTLVTNYDNNNYIVTNGNGLLYRKGIASNNFFTYPIGFDVTTYNPIVLQQNNGATTDDIGIRCLEKVYTNGTTGIANTSGVVNATWELKEKIAGGNNATIIPQWYAQDELPGFDPNKCGVSKYTGNGNWDLLYSQASGRLGTNPYNKSRIGLTDFGVFAVGSKPVSSKTSVNMKVFLQGPFVTNLMDDYMRTLMPTRDSITTRPESTYVHKGWGGNEIAATGVLSSQTLSNNNVVDWIYLELRDPNDPANVLFTRACLLQRDGDVIDENGNTIVSFYGVPPRNYYVCVRHRNHLGFRTANAISLSSTPTTLNFTNNSVVLYGATPVTNVTTTLLAMNAGDANSDGSIDAFDTILWEQQNGLFDDYVNNADYNMDGSVDAFDTILWEINNGKFQEID